MTICFRVVYVELCFWLVADTCHVLRLRPVAKVQLLIRTSAVVSSLVMASAVSRRDRFLESVLSNPHVKLRA